MSDKNFFSKIKETLIFCFAHRFMETLITVCISSILFMFIYSIVNLKETVNRQEKTAATKNEFDLKIMRSSYRDCMEEKDDKYICIVYAYVAAQTMLVPIEE